MRKKYPENIADIENFYQSSLEGIKIEPSAAMWDRIEASLDKDKKPKGFFFSFTTKQIISSLAVILLIGVSGYFAFNNQPDSPVEQKTIPALSQDSSSFLPEENVIENSQPKETTKKEKLSENIKIDKEVEQEDQSDLSPKETLNSDKSLVPEVTADTTPAKTSIAIPEPIKEEKVKEEPAPKEKVSFKEKYKKKYQDSTRPLFVPTK